MASHFTQEQGCKCEVAFLFTTKITYYMHGRITNKCAMYTRESDGLFDNFEQQHIFSQDVYPFFNPCLEQEAAPGLQHLDDDDDEEHDNGGGSDDWQQ